MSAISFYITTNTNSGIICLYSSWYCYSFFFFDSIFISSCYSLCVIFVSDVDTCVIRFYPTNVNTIRTLCHFACWFITDVYIFSFKTVLWVIFWLIPSKSICLDTTFNNNTTITTLNIATNIHTDTGTKNTTSRLICAYITTDVNNFVIRLWRTYRLNITINLNNSAFFFNYLFNTIFHIQHAIRLCLYFTINNYTLGTMINNIITNFYSFWTMTFDTTFLNIYSARFQISNRTFNYNRTIRFYSSTCHRINFYTTFYMNIWLTTYYFTCFGCIGSSFINPYTSSRRSINTTTSNTCCIWIINSFNFTNLYYWGFVWISTTDGVYFIKGVNRSILNVDGVFSRRDYFISSECCIRRYGLYCSFWNENTAV